MWSCGFGTIVEGFGDSVMVFYVGSGSPAVGGVDALVVKVLAANGAFGVFVAFVVKN